MPPYLDRLSLRVCWTNFNRYYANALAGTIANSSPRIKRNGEPLRRSHITANALPATCRKSRRTESRTVRRNSWVLDAKNEGNRKRTSHRCLDMVRMHQGLSLRWPNYRKQLSNGGFAWSKGGSDDRFVTQYIATGFGHLQHLKVLLATSASLQTVKWPNAVAYPDKRLKEDYDKLEKAAKLTENNTAIWSNIVYAFPKPATPAETMTAYNFYRKQAQQYWLPQTVDAGYDSTGAEQNRWKSISPPGTLCLFAKCTTSERNGHVLVRTEHPGLLFLVRTRWNPAIADRNIYRSNQRYQSCWSDENLVAETKTNTELAYHQGHCRRPCFTVVWQWTDSIKYTGCYYSPAIIPINSKDRR